MLVDLFAGGHTLGSGFAANPAPPPQPFDVDKIVFLGASITDQSVSGESTRLYAEGFVKNSFGKTVDIVERATAGWDISDLAANIDSIIAEFSAEPNTHYVMHVGGNDVIYQTEYLELLPAKQQQMIDDLAYIYDAIHAQGRKLIQSSITFRNYQGTTIDNDPAIKINELDGSYTYVRDWIVPVMEDKAPEYLLNGWPQIDLYNSTRNIYQDWNDGADVVHPNKWARIIYTQTMVEGFMVLSEGASNPPVTPYNFNDIPVAGPAIDMTAGFSCQNASGDNVTWLLRNQFAGSAIDDFKAQLSDSSGDATGSHIYTSVNYGWVGGEGNTADPSNSTASLENNELLSSYVGVSTSGAVLYIMVDGLTPFAEYELQSVSAKSLGTPQLNDVYNHIGVPVSVDLATTTPQNNIISGNRIADYNGRLFVAVAEDSTENRALINGVRVKSNG